MQIFISCLSNAYKGMSSHTLTFFLLLHQWHTWSLDQQCQYVMCSRVFYSLQTLLAQLMKAFVLQHLLGGQQDDVEQDVGEEWENIWSCKSPHGLYPYPPDAATAEAMRAWSSKGIPEQLAASCSDSMCPCGNTYSLVLINNECTVLYPDPCGGHPRPMYELQCSAENPECTLVYDGLFHYSDSTCVSCACCMAMQMRA